MPSGDIKGGKSIGKRLGQAFDLARLREEIASEQESNIEVGDFLSELATAVKFRMKAGLSQGDWIEEPERFFTDGLVFGREVASSAEVKLQVTLSLDASTSMWANRLMKHAGPSILAFDRIIRKAALELPVGSIAYAPFIFHETAHKIPAPYLNCYVGRAEKKSGEEIDESIWPLWPRADQLALARQTGEASPTATQKDFKLSGEDTNIAPLFKAIQAWEQREGDPNAVRLDIVITDGVLENGEDVQDATRVQEERNGRLRTVLLNFLPLDQWSNFQLPDRCSQFAVTADNLDFSVRTILQEAVADLFA